MKIQINQNQCGFLLKDGCFVKTLYSGIHRYIKAMGYEVVVEDMEGMVEFDKAPREVLPGRCFGYGFRRGTSEFLRRMA